MSNEQVKAIRRRAWHSLSYGIGRSVGMTLDQMKQFIAGTYRPNDEQLTQLARRMGDGAMTDTTIQSSGLDAIREALRVRSTKGHLGNLARDLSIGVGTLEMFATSSARLPDPTLQLLVKELFAGHLFYDAASDKLRPTVKEPPKSLGVRPENNVISPTYQAGACARPPTMVRDANTVTQPNRLAWLQRWF